MGASSNRPKRARQQRRADARADATTQSSGTPRIVVPAPPFHRRAFLVQALVIAILTLAAHSSSLRNLYAFDDELLILRNIPVQRGISGIGEIFTTHIFASYFESQGDEGLAANRHYRPLSIMTFAIEQSLFGQTLGDEYRAVRAEWNDPSAQGEVGDLEARLNDVERRIDQANRDIAFARHLDQILLYAITMVLLLFFLQQCILPGSPWAAFIATVLFALHPVHAEVVANIKSRDEILSLLFIVVSGIFVFAWDRTRKPGAMVLAMVALALALLSKEYAVIAPAIFGAALVLVRGRKVRAVIQSMLPLLGVIVLFLIVRQAFIAGGASSADRTPDILIDPFLKLRTGEASGSIVATKIDILLKYVRLLLYPHPLSSDYSYAAFAYRSFASPTFWLSLFLYLALIAATLYAWQRRHILALAGILYLGFLFLTQLGAFLGERLVFHASLGFTLLLGWAIAKLPRAAALALCALIAIPYGVLTFQRDRAWKDNRTLFLTDVKTVPRSTLVNGNAGTQVLNEALDRLRERNRAKQSLTPADQRFIKAKAADALVYLQRAVTIHDGNVAAWTNVGIAHYYREEWDAAADAFAKAAAISPTRPALRQYATNFHMLGMALAKSGNLPAATDMFRRATAADPAEVRLQSDYGSLAFMAMRFDEAKTAFQHALTLAPNDRKAATGLAAATEFDRVTRATRERPNDPQAFADLAELLAKNPQPNFVAAAARARATSEGLRRRAERGAQRAE